MKRIILAGALLLALSACHRDAGQKKAEAPPPVTTEEPVTGWLVADGAGETGVVYRDAADAPGFAMSCRQASKTFRLATPDPIETTPIAKETANLILGDEGFIVPVAAGSADASGGRSLVVEVPVESKLLRALADAKTARLEFRDAFVETGVDTEGKLLAFSQRCEKMTGVSASP